MRVKCLHVLYFVVSNQSYSCKSTTKVSRKSLVIRKILSRQFSVQATGIVDESVAEHETKAGLLVVQNNISEMKQNKIIKTEIKQESATLLSSTSSSSSSATITDQEVLIDLGTLIPMLVVSRPSKLIKSPYVADLIIQTNKHRQIIDDATFSNQERTIGTESIKKQSIKSIKVSIKAKIDLVSTALRSSVTPEELHLGHTPALDCAGS